MTLSNSIQSIPFKIILSFVIIVAISLLGIVIQYDNLATVGRTAEQAVIEDEELENRIEELRLDFNRYSSAIRTIPALLDHKELNLIGNEIFSLHERLLKEVVYIQNSQVQFPQAAKFKHLSADLGVHVSMMEMAAKHMMGSMRVYAQMQANKIYHDDVKESVLTVNMTLNELFNIIHSHKKSLAESIERKILAKRGLCLHHGKI